MGGEFDTIAAEIPKIKVPRNKAKHAQAWGTMVQGLANASALEKKNICIILPGGTCCFAFGKRDSFSRSNSQAVRCFAGRGD